MPLTPEDVSNKRFTTVRLREGYDMTEVDQFLDEVEAALATMTRENDELRTKLQAAQGGEAVVPEAPAAPTAAPVAEGAQAEETASETAPEAEAPAEEAPSTEVPAEETSAEEPVAEEAGTAAPAEEAAPEPAATVAAPAPAPAAMETLQVTTTAEASAAATRLLELAGRNADELVLEARQQADQIVGDARTTAEALEAEARTRAEALDQETAERRQAVFGDIEQEKAALDTEITNLRTFEREYRAQLRSYFEQQLEALDSHGEGASLAEPIGHQADDRGGAPQEGEPSRLQALLGDEEPELHDAQQDEPHDQQHGDYQ